ncbi:FAD binding domain-containing protein, partial [Streptomyces coeruleorubidus]
MTTHAPQAAQAVTLPTTLDEAVAALTAVPAAVPVAGGTDLMAAVNSGQLRPAALVGQAMGDDTLEIEAGRVMVEEIAEPL